MIRVVSVGRDRDGRQQMGLHSSPGKVLHEVPQVPAAGTLEGKNMYPDHERFPKTGGGDAIQLWQKDGDYIG